ncbi:MAG TPA: ABC transporter ATP-binding protein [Vicinamibacterales bacterium]|nr:ABC transporter ATP-binding protein [Vicinamibacterales bacterium]HPW21983.1 ABC transporter ATP-binding protein [Vicinamibacterales bacterium]
MDGRDDEIIAGKAYDAVLMRRLLTYLRPYWRQVLLALVCIAAGSMLQLAQPYLMKLAIDRYIADRDLAGLDRIALLFLGILGGAFAAEFVQAYVLQSTGQRIMFDIRAEIYRHLQRLDIAFHDRNPVGRLMTRVTTDVDALNDLFASGVVSVFGDVFTLAGIMIVLLTMDWRLALVAFSVLPAIVVVTQWFRRRVRDSYREVRGWIARINAFLQENITGMATVQLFRRESVNGARFGAINACHRDANIQSIFYYAVFYPAIEIVGAAATALLIWQGGVWVLGGSLTLGSLVAFIQYSRRFFRPISDLSEKFNLLQSAMAASERIFALLDTPVRVAPPAAPRAAAPEGRVAFDGVSFAYDGERDVLRDVSFEVQPGQRVGIVGATGAGKSTIINLLLRFYDVRRGRILVDGVDIRDMDLGELRRRFSLVLQDVHLFSGTIGGNVRMGDATIDDARVRRALEAVHADRFVDRLPQGIDTLVAERGATLSTGQKQLLSFARALAFDPRILVLDEATSSIDTETEVLIRDALRVLMAGRTTIAIAHRLSTIQDMDRILVLHKGRLREAGSHQELLAQRGIYYRLYQLQYAGG